jgi:hypothetical protein
MQSSEGLFCICVSKLTTVHHTAHKSKTAPQHQVLGAGSLSGRVAKDNNYRDMRNLRIIFRPKTCIADSVREYVLSGASTACAR